MIVKVSNYVEAYRIKALYAKDVHELAGAKTPHNAATEFTNRNIMSVLNIRADHELLDIGCGDGCLLTIAKSEGFVNASGLTGSEEEAERLRSLGLNVCQGLTDSLPLADSSCDVVVCNSVLLIVPLAKIPASLSEISRIAKPGAQIYLGEIPRAPEHAGVPRHETISSMLSYLLQTHGLRTFLGACRRIIWKTLCGEPIILNQAPVIEFFAEPEEFVGMAAAYGMKLERQFQHRYLDEKGNIRISDTRMNYVFTKAA